MSNDNKVTRKLSAILSADVKGYSLLMADDEIHTIQTLKVYRSLMSDLINQHSGRVVDNPGDNLLAEFGSAVDAVECAVEIQRRLKKENAKFVEDMRLHFRIGINIGDVVQDSDRIYGEGVNIAARIESLADAGGICISRGTYDHIKKKLDFLYEYIGEHSVKNISDPVRVYKVLMDKKDAGEKIKKSPNLPVKKSKLKKWLKITASIILILSAVLVGFYWKYIYLPAPADIDPEGKMEFNLPEGPSIAVLPFVNMSKDPEQEYLCDGLTENLISALAQVPQALVISRNSTFAYKGKPIDARQIGQELGARYLIEGSIQKTTNRFRIVVQLIDTDTGLHIWSERYDSKFQDIFDLQDEITLKILKALGVKFNAGVKQYAGILQGISDIQSIITLAKLGEYLGSPTKERSAWALESAEKLIVSNPEYRYRYDMLAGVYLIGAINGCCEPYAICLLKGSEAVKKSLSLDENNFSAHNHLGSLFVMKKKHDNAILEYKKAIELNPNSADSYSAIGWVLNLSDKPAESLEYLNKGLRLNPIPSVIWLSALGGTYRLLGQYEKAIELYKKCIEREPNFWGSYGGLAVAYSLSGQDKKAKTAVRQLLEVFPGYSIRDVKKTSLYKNQDRLDLVIKAYRNAGLPE